MRTRGLIICWNPDLATFTEGKVSTSPHLPTRVVEISRLDGYWAGEQVSTSPQVFQKVDSVFNINQ